MPNRTAKLALIVFVSVLAGIPFGTSSYSATPAADDCLSAPNGQTPEGSHWYYRIERGTKRHCWYLRQGGERVSQNAPSSALPSAKPIAPKADPAIRGSVANARAELSPAQTRDTADSTAATAPLPPTPGLNATSSTAHQPVTVPDTSTPPPTVASRWPEPSSTVPSASQTQAAADVDDTDVQPAAPVAVPPPPVALAAADAPAEKSPGHSGSIPMLSIVMMGALALAGLIGSVIVRFGGRRRRNRVGIAVDRDAMWDAISPEPRSSRATEARSSRPAPPVAAPMPRRPGFTMPRELQMADHAADRRDDRVTEMLARLARSAAR